MSFDPGSRVVLVFDTDTEVTEHLKKNIELLRKVCSKVEVLTVAQVLNFEDEMVRSTDISKVEDIGIFYRKRKIIRRLANTPFRKCGNCFRAR